MDGKTLLAKLRQSEPINMDGEEVLNPPSGGLGRVLASSLEPFLSNEAIVPFAMQIYDPLDSKWTTYVVIDFGLLVGESFCTESGGIANANIQFYPFDRLEKVFSFRKGKMIDSKDWGGIVLEFSPDFRLEIIDGNEDPSRSNSVGHFLSVFLRQYSLYRKA